MRITRIAVEKAQALPSTIDECFAKSRKASLTAQKKSRDPSCGLGFSFCVSTVIISCSRRASRKRSPLPVTHRAAEPHFAGPRIGGRLTAKIKPSPTFYVQPRSRKIRSKIGIGIPRSQSKMYPVAPACLILFVKRISDLLS